MTKMFSTHRPCFYQNQTLQMILIFLLEFLFFVDNKSSQSIILSLKIKLKMIFYREPLFWNLTQVCSFLFHLSDIIKVHSGKNF